MSLDCLLLHTDENLYPFGFSAGDSRLFRTDDGSSSVIFLFPRFRFFGTSQSILYVSLILLLYQRSRVISTLQTETTCMLTMDTYQMKNDSVLYLRYTLALANIHVFQNFLLQVNTNGILSFRSRFTSPLRRSFPFFSVPLIAPYWDNVDTRRFGNIFYRQTTDTNLLARARNQLQELFPSAGNFTPTYLFIATWDRVVQRFGGSQVG